MEQIKKNIYTVLFLLTKQVLTVVLPFTILYFCSVKGILPYTSLSMGVVILASLCLCYLMLPDDVIAMDAMVSMILTGAVVTCYTFLYFECTEEGKTVMYPITLVVNILYFLFELSIVRRYTKKMSYP